MDVNLLSLSSEAEDLRFISQQRGAGFLACRSSLYIWSAATCRRFVKRDASRLTKRRRAGALQGAKPSA